MLGDLEQNHRTLLVRRRKVLEQLTDGTAQTLDQISRRLAILDEEYSFIRTHIFWVRDREPIGPGTITQGAREGQHVLKALIRLAQESARPSTWGRPSAEFVTASLAVLGLPIGLFRLRRVLRAQIVRDFPPGGPKVA
jgi:potassium efflux system protein